MKDIKLPRRVLVGDHAIEHSLEVVLALGLSGPSRVICDPTTKRIAGEKVSKQLGSDVLVVSDAATAELEDITAKIIGDKIRFILGVGGGSIIDLTKIVAYNAKIPFISVPTAASHDGIASPQASVKKPQPMSVKTDCPLAIIADTEVISKAPPRLFSSGCADVISHYTSVLDWKLARDEKGEYYGDYAAALSKMSAQVIIDNAHEVRKNISMLVEALISNGVAMGIAGSSRPCSGSEHNFSHALDQICKTPALHGEQCGVGAIMMAYLHNADWKSVRDSLKAVQAPTTAKALAVSRDDVIEALMIAHKIRDRYTILRDGLSREDAVRLAEATGVI